MVKYPHALWLLLTLFSCQPSQKKSPKIFVYDYSIGKEDNPQYYCLLKQLKNKWLLEISGSTTEYFARILLFFATRLDIAKRFIFLVTTKMYYNVNLVLLVISTA